MDFDQLREKIFAVNQKFYDKIYKDPWLKDVFVVIKQDIIEKQQTDFMLGALGGPKRYSGVTPDQAHPHMFIDQEMWDLREKYLKEAFKETGFPPDLANKWLKIDEAFKKSILKKDLSECQKRFPTDTIIYVPNPNKTKKAA